MNERLIEDIRSIMKLGKDCLEKDDATLEEMVYELIDIIPIVMSMLEIGREDQVYMGVEISPEERVRMYDVAMFALLYGAGLIADTRVDNF